MEELLNSIDGVTVIREIEGRVADLAPVKLVLALSIVFLVAGIFLGIIVVVQFYDTLQYFAGIVICVAFLGSLMSVLVIDVGEPTKYEIMLDADADKTSLTEAFEVVRGNGLTFIVEPRREEQKWQIC